jgi:hypothetical protein
VEELWQRVSQGRHTALLGIVPGEPPAALGIRVMRVRCDVPKTTLGPLLEAQRKVELLLGDAPLLDQARSRVVTGLRRRLLGDIADATADAAAIEALNRLAQHADQRYALVLDAVEEADEATLDVLRRIVSRPDALRVPLVLSFRTPEPLGAAGALVAAVRKAGGAEAVLRTAEGESLASEVAAGGAEGAWRGLPPESLRVLRAGAVVGSGFEADLLASLLGVDPIEVLEALQRAADAGVPIEDRGEGRFHLPEALLEEIRGSLLPSLSRAWHRRLARLLSEDEAETFDDGGAGRRARHAPSAPAGGHAPAAHAPAAHAAHAAAHPFSVPAAAIEESELLRKPHEAPSHAAAPPADGGGAAIADAGSTAGGSADDEVTQVVPPRAAGADGAQLGTPQPDATAGRPPASVPPQPVWAYNEIFSREAVEEARKDAEARAEAQARAEAEAEARADADAEAEAEARADADADAEARADADVDADADPEGRAEAEARKDAETRAGWEIRAGTAAAGAAWPEGPARHAGGAAGPFAAAEQEPAGGPRRGAPRADEGRAATHLTAAGDLDEATQRYCAAAAQASAAGAYLQALAYGQRALALLGDLPSTPARRRMRVVALTEIARVHLQAAGPSHAAGGEPGNAAFTLSGALEVLEAARALLAPDDPPGLHAEVAVLIADACYELGDMRSLERALEELTGASRRLLAAGDPSGAARLLNDQAAVYVRVGDPVRATHLLSESRRVFEQKAATDPIALIEIAETDHLFAKIPLHVAARPGREGDALSMGLDHALAAERTYKKVGAARELGRVWETMGRLELRKGRIERAVQRLSAAIEVQQATGDLVGLARSTAALSEALSAEGRHREALLVLAESIALNLEKGSPIGLAFNRRSLDALRPRVSPHGEVGGTVRQVAAQLAAAESALGRIKLPGERD